MARYISCYLIEIRRMGCHNGDAAAMWTSAGSSIKEELSLTAEPVDTRLEYRLRAVNRAGESEPTNTVAVVL